jgi:peptidoglycan hydrolase CwlO-like protein
VERELKKFTQLCDDKDHELRSLYKSDKDKTKRLAQSDQDLKSIQKKYDKAKKYGRDLED